MTQLMVGRSAKPRQRQVQARAEETRQRIIDAAVQLFAARGFDGVAMRDIALASDRPLSALTYHFESKDDLWRHAAATIHGKIASYFAQRIAGLEGVDVRTSARLILKDYILYVARNPELVRFMINLGFEDSERLDWYANNLSTPFRDQFDAVFGEMARQHGIAQDSVRYPLLIYMVSGAAALLHATAPEVRATSGLDPSEPAVRDQHIEMMIELFLPSSAAEARRLQAETPTLIAPDRTL